MELHLLLAGGVPGSCAERERAQLLSGGDGRQSDARKRTGLVEVETAGQAAGVELPGPGVPDPALADGGRVAVGFPGGMRTDLDELLRLGVAVGVAEAVRRLQVLGVAGGAVVVVGGVGEGGGVAPVDLPPAIVDVEGRAVLQARGAAPGRDRGVDDHLAVPGHVGGGVTVAVAAVVLPAAADVQQVELAPGPAPSLDLQTQPDDEVRRLRHLQPAAVAAY